MSRPSANTWCSVTALSARTHVRKSGLRLTNIHFLSQPAAAACLFDSRLGHRIFLRAFAVFLCVRWHSESYNHMALRTALCRGAPIPWARSPWPQSLFTMAPNICVSWVWNLLLVTIMQPRILEVAPTFWQNLCDPGIQCTPQINMHKVTCCCCTVCCTAEKTYISTMPLDSGFVWFLELAVISYCYTISSLAFVVQTDCVQPFCERGLSLCTVQINFWQQNTNRPFFFMQLNIPYQLSVNTVKNNYEVYVKHFFFKPHYKFRPKPNNQTLCRYKIMKRW